MVLLHEALKVLRLIDDKIIYELSKVLPQLLSLEESMLNRNAVNVINKFTLILSCLVNYTLGPGCSKADYQIIMSEQINI